MNKLWWLWIVSLTVYFLWKFIHRNNAVVDRYEYLEIMSFQEWKLGRLIKKEMEKKKSGWIDSGIFYISMMELEDEGLIERRLGESMYPGTLSPHEFRKKIGGKRKRKEEINSIHLPAFQHA